MLSINNALDKLAFRGYDQELIFKWSLVFVIAFISGMVVGVGKTGALIELAFHAVGLR